MTMNPFSVAGTWRVDPDNRQDRGDGKVKKYKLTPEEIEALYGKPNPKDITRKPKPFSQTITEIKKNKEEADRFMSKITIEQLVKECTELGFTNAAYTSIAKKYGFTSAHGVACLVSKKGIKKLVNQVQDTRKPYEKPIIENIVEKEEQKDEAIISGFVPEFTPTPVTGIHDSGNREDCGTGAVRDTQEGKGRFDLITPEGLFRLARWYELGANKYSDRNWERGMPITRCISSAMRHLVKYMAGYRDEDHLAAVVWNVFAIMHFERFMPELDDRPEWAKQNLNPN